MTSPVRAAVQCFQKVRKKFSETPWQIARCVVQCKRSQERLEKRDCGSIRKKAEIRKKLKKPLDKSPKLWYNKGTKGEGKATARTADPRESVRPLPDDPTARCVGVAGYKCEPDPTGWNNVGDMPTTKATHYVVVFQCGRTHGLRGRGMLVRLQPITPKKIKKPLDKWLKMWYNK